MPSTHPNEIRGPIESEHNALRDAREQEYTAAKRALEDEYHTDLASLAADKRAALVAAGLNSDGGVPPTFDANLPTNVTAPAVTGTATTGQTLTCSEGSWENADSFAYQWMRDGSAIGGATANTRVLVLADEGTSLKCRVTATNESGTATADSNTVSPTA